MSYETKQINYYTYTQKFCIGEGNYGKVFQGIDIRDNSQVAIKMIDLKFINHDNYIKNQLQNEIEILKIVSHRNIVKFIDLVQQQQQIYIITEYCQGGDLKELLSQKQCTESEAFEFLCQIIDAFKYLHDHNIIHRDLKPANILIDNGTYKLADFGFAKYLNNYNKALMKSYVGSPYYMSPQLLANGQYSYKTDIWSLGIIYYEMLFNTLPWIAGDCETLLQKITNEPINFKKNNIKISQDSIKIIQFTLTQDESKRISWEDLAVFVQNCTIQRRQRPENSNYTNLEQSTQVKSAKLAQFQRSFSQQDSFQSISSTKKKKIFATEDISDKSTVTNEHSYVIESFRFSKYIHRQRAQCAIVHYICCEIIQNITYFLKFIEDEIILYKMLIFSSKLVYLQVKQLVKDISDKQLKQQEIFQISNEIQNEYQCIKDELLYYDQFYKDVNQMSENKKTLSFILEDKQNKFFLTELNFSENDIYQLEEIVLSFSISFIHQMGKNFKDPLDHMRVNQQQQLRVILITLEIFMDYIGLKIRIDKSIEVDFDEVYNNKGTIDDINILIEKINSQLQVFLLDH